MLAMAIVVVMLRWMHIVAAALVIGGLFFMQVILPAGLSLLAPEQREAVFLRCRRGFKMTVHPAILLILVSGVYNSIGNFPAYKANPALLHGLWGMHMLLGAIAIGISIWLLAGRTGPAKARQWAMLNLLILLVLVGVASTLKWAREGATRPAAMTQDVH